MSPSDSGILVSPSGTDVSARLSICLDDKDLLLKRRLADDVIFNIKRLRVNNGPPSMDDMFVI